MEPKQRSNFTLGIFVLAGLGLFIGGLYYLGKQRNLFGDTITVYGIFYDVSGLQSGNNVRFAGINVGTVEDIYLSSDSTAMVSMVLKKDATKFIKKDSQLIIGSEGLMGNKTVTIYSGSADEEQVAENDTLDTLTPVSIDDITNNLAVVTENASAISDDIATMTASIRRGEGLLGKLIFDKKFANNITRTTANLAKGSEKISAVAEETKGLVENTGEVIKATKKSFLFRGYFRRKERREREAKEKAIKEQEKTSQQQEKTVEKTEPDGTKTKETTETKKETKKKFKLF